jgi:quercetin dioxygenase-like cupin family protein
VKKCLFGIVRAAALAGMACIPAAALAQDAVKTAPESYKVAVENASIRALDIRIPAGGRTPMHSHPASLLTVFGPCKMRFTAADGKKSDVEFKGGEIVWREAETHAGENIGPGECHAMQVEMKQPLPPARKM